MDLDSRTDMNCPALDCRCATAGMGLVGRVDGMESARLVGLVCLVGVGDGLSGRDDPIRLVANGREWW
jgi:hypothetical protein